MTGKTIFNKKKNLKYESEAFGAKWIELTTKTLQKIYKK